MSCGSWKGAGIFALLTHHASVDVFVTVLAGRLIITQEAMATEVTAGDYVIIPSGAPHSLECLDAARILIFR